MENDVPKRGVSTEFKFGVNKTATTMLQLSNHSKKEQPAAKYAFPTEDDDQDDSLNIQAKQPAYGASSTATYSASKYETASKHPPPPPAGPSVLDKFGNLRKHISTHLNIWNNIRKTYQQGTSVVLSKLLMQRKNHQSHQHFDHVRIVELTAAVRVSYYEIGTVCQFECETTWL